MSPHKDFKADPGAKTTQTVVGRPDAGAAEDDAERTREMPAQGNQESATTRSPADAEPPRPRLRSAGDQVPDVQESVGRASGRPDAKGTLPAPMMPARRNPATGTPPARDKTPSFEEISSSLLLPDENTGGLASGKDRADKGARAAVPSANLEELSGSLLLDDGPESQDPPVVARVKPLSRSPGVPGSRRPAAAAADPQLGISELPKVTTPPKVDHDGTSPATPGRGRNLVDGIAQRDPWRSTRPAPAEAPLATAQWPAREATVDESTAQPRPADAGSAPPDLQAAWGDRDVEDIELPRGRLGVFALAIKSALGKLRTVRLGSFRWVRLPGARPPWLLLSVALAGLVVGAAVALLVHLAHSAANEVGETDTRGSQAATAPTHPSPSSTVAPSAGPDRARSAEPPMPACALAGAPHVVAPSAVLAAGVEVRPLGGDVALGFASRDHEALAVRLDPASLSALGTAQAHSSDPIHRVTPVASAKGSLGLAVDADRKGDSLQGRRVAPGDPPVQLGAAGEGLAWARLGGPVAGKLWTLDGDGDVESLRAAAEGATGETAIAFRRRGAVWLGTALVQAGTPAAHGELSRVEGLGPMVGSPSVAVNDSVVMAAWADRPSAEDAWRMRWVHFRPGEAPGEASTFEPPAGGKGGQAMSPALSAIPGGRFLLVWTEGPASRHDVRALTLSNDGKPVGAPLEVSAEGTNAGQGQGAVGDSGTGVVAFLESADIGFQVVARSISCSAP